MRRILAVSTLAILAASVCIPMLCTGALADTWYRAASGGIAGGFNAPQVRVSSLAEYGGRLYAGTRSNAGGQVWRYDGGAWEPVMEGGFGDSDNRDVSALAEYAGSLYAGTYRQSGRCQVWRYNGATWVKVSTTALETAANMTVSSMAAFDGKLVVGTSNGSGCNVLSYDGAAWSVQTADGWGDANDDAASSMAVYGTSLFIGTSNPVTACEVHAWDGTPGGWTTAVGAGGWGAPAGFGDVGNLEASSMTVFDDGVPKLWMGTRNDAAAQVWCYDSVGVWSRSTLVGDIDADSDCVTSLQAFDNGSSDILYAGTENTTDGCEVYRFIAGVGGGWFNEIGTGPGVNSYGFGDPANTSVPAMLHFGAGLAAGTSQGLYAPDSGCQVWDLSDTGTWSQVNYNGFAPNAQVTASCSATVAGKLYVGTVNTSTGGKVWRYDGNSWSNIHIPGFSYHNQAISCMAADGDDLWVGTRNPSTGGEVWLYDGSWHVKAGPPGGAGDISLGPENEQVSSLAVLSGELWLGTYNQNGCQVWYNDAPGSWSKSVDTGWGDATNVMASTMAVYDGELFAGTWRSDGCCVYRYDGAGSWTQLVGPAAAVAPGFGNDRNRGAMSSTVWDSRLCVGTHNSNAGCDVWAYDGSSWIRNASGGWGDADNESACSMMAVDGRLYVGTEKYPNGGKGAELWVNNGSTWRQANADGFGKASNDGIMSLAVLGAHLYAGTANYSVGLEVFRGTANPSLSSIDPAQANGGATVTLSGTNFGMTRGGSYVTVGSFRVQDYVSWSDGRVKFQVPPGPSGNVSVTLTTTLGTSNALSLKVSNPVWYLAEGSSDWGFDTYITVENPNSQEVEARVTYMTKDGPVSRAAVRLPAASQTTLNPRDDIGAQDFSTRVECVQGKDIAVDRRMVWTGRGAASPEGHSSIGVTAPAKVWYLPEGSSKWGFECWLLIQNPNGVEATCQITYMIEGGLPKTVTRAIDANSRMSFNIYDDIGEADASIMVSADHVVIPERAMYRNDRREGHDSIGTVSPAGSFYLAEGTTAWGFTTYVLIQNPNDGEARVTLTYMTGEGPVVQPELVLPGTSRRTVRVNDVLPQKDFSTLVASDRPVIAERAMYWDNGTGEASHDSIGMSAPHRIAYLPDGETYNGHETFTLVQNPNAVDVMVEVKYLTNGETANQVFTDTVAAGSRKTYNMGDRLPSGKSSVVVTCKTPGRKIMVERSMYWYGRGAGTDTIGGCAD